MMAEEEMLRLPERMQKLSGKSIVARWNSEKTERHRRRKLGLRQRYSQVKDTEGVRLL